VKSKKLLVFQIIVLTALAIFIPSAMAQTGSTSALTGRVSDPTGAVLPGVSVTVTSVATNQSRMAVTAEDGVYRVALLDPGAYKVKFALPGFKTAEVPDITLAVTETAVLNQTLAVGAASEEVTVEANVEALQTATSTLGTTVTGNSISNLPLVSRNFTAVLGMAAGVAVAATNGTAFGKGTENMSVNGANPEKNNFQMDGVAINNAAGNNAANDAGLYTGIAVPNPDAIQEFKIQTSTYDASYGRNPGANVNVVTKGGSNEFHGTLFEFFRNEALNANDFFYNRDRRPGQRDKQILRQNQFGGSIGGPVVKDKIFFFGSYQGTRQFNGVAAQGTTSATLFPIPDNRETSDFATRLGAATCGFPTRGGSIAVACDGSNINPVAIALLRVKLPDGSYYIPGSGTSGTRQQLFSIPAKYKENQFIANGDWIMNSAHSLQVRLMKAKNPYEYQLNGQLPGRYAIDARSNESGLLRLTSILSPALVNQARVSVQRIIQRGSETLPYTPQQVGIKPLIDSSCCNGTTGGSYTQPPVMTILGAFNIGGMLAPSDAPTTQIQLSDQLSWTRGTHTLRVGWEYEFVRWPLTFGGLGRGNLQINSFADFLIGRAGCAPSDTTCSPTNPGNTTGSPSSSFNLCLFCVRSTALGIVHNYALRNQYAFFQDDWTVNSRLTLNIGVRWERFGQLGDKYGNLTNFWASDLKSVPIPPSAPNFSDPKAFAGYVVPNNYDTRPISQGGHGPIPAGVRQFDGRFASENRIPLSNFAPRIGFAWQPMGSGRFVVRGGAGIFYDRVGINRMVHAVQEGRPYADTLTLQHDVASLQSPFQDRPLALLPRWYDFTRLTGSNFDSPYYDHIQTPLVRQYNLGIQYEVARSYILEIAYVGSSGINIGDYSHNVNIAQLASPSNPINGITTNTVQNASARVPYLGFTPIGLQKNAFDAIYNYNSLQTTMRKQFSRGFGFQASYTFSKNLSNVGFNSANMNNPNDMDQQYGQTPYSRPHRFFAGYQYDLPFKANGVLGKFVQGWSASGGTLIQSGNPITLFDGRGGTIYTGGPPTNGSDKGASRAQLCPGKTYADIATTGSVKERLGRAGDLTVKRFFNASAFCAPNALGNGTDFGDAGIGIVRGPGQTNTDFSITKTTPIGERQSLQFRSEFFNLFNHPQFALPSDVVGNQSLYPSSANFGLITATSINPRLIQFAVRIQF
jgi:Carboxypeptidase regulatory-like domain/TonB dependent receptor-like, beta-barrel/TonB-dependent Receptor Plug Domain